MTIKDLIDAIAEALFQEFGSDYEIYTEKVEQGLNGRCFLIRCLNPTKNVFLGQCYKRTNQFSVQYIPSTTEANDECFSVLERLFECLKDVTLFDKPIHGMDMGGNVTEGILTFTVNYDGFELDVKAVEDEMDSFNVVTQAKG